MIYNIFCAILCFLFFTNLSAENVEFNPFEGDVESINPEDSEDPELESLFSSSTKKLFKTICKQANQSEPTDDHAAPMANLEGEPSAYIHQCVNVITGNFCDFQTDLIVHHGIDPLHWERSFAGSTTGLGILGAGWHANHASVCLYYEKKNWRLYRDDHGGKPFMFGGDQPRSILKRGFNKGITNNCRGSISGQSDLRNIRGIIGKDPNGDFKASLTTGSRTKRRYVVLPKSEHPLARIKEETHPSGNAFLYDYEYSDHENWIKKINLCNSRKKSCGFLTFDTHTEKHLKKLKTKVIKTQDGRWVHYNFDKVNGLYVLRSVERSDAPREEYYYLYSGTCDNCMAKISSKELPNKRTLGVSYYEYGQNLVIDQDINLCDPIDPRINRVKKLLARAGSDDKLHVIYQFIYDLYVEPNPNPAGNSYRRDVRHGSCWVINPVGHKTQYHFNEDQRLTVINKYHADGRHYTYETLVWGDREGKDNTCLLARSLCTSEGGGVFLRTYEYDERGNVLVDRLSGNLSGQNRANPAVQANGTTSPNGCECYTKYKTYSDDGFNLVLTEDDGRIQTTYQYAPNTNRLVAKFQSSGSQQLRRWFYEYNEDSAITKEIVDDGTSEKSENLSGVTHRKITYYTQSTSYPVAFPLIIEEKCLDLETGQEKLIHKVVNTYTNQAKISKQEHYDANGNFAYTLLWEYNKLGKVTKEVNALGQTITRRYDNNGNCIFEQGRRNDVHKVFVYDFMNRLIKEQEVHADGTKRSISHSYNLASQRISTTDQNGNQTLFAYDAFGRLIQTTYPEVVNENQEVCCPVTKKGYDPMSNVTSEINEKGIERQKSYTIRGQLVEAIFPDGTTERNIYDLNGTRKESKARNNTITRYTYDAFGRPTQINIYSESDELLSSSSVIYNGFHVVQETDPKGVSTHFSYYPDGKLKSKQKENLRTTFEYDALGRLHTTKEWDVHNPEMAIMIKTQDHDLLNRVIADATMDGTGNVITKTEYVYDVTGNICQLVNYTQAGPAFTKTTYDSHGTPILVEDAEGNKTITVCRYDYKNQLGQIVPYKEITDPLGNIIIEICDALGRSVSTIKKNAFGKTTQQQNKTYDLKGNLCSIQDVIINGSELSQTVTSLMFYDSSDRLIACYEAYGTPEQKQTKITYDAFGQKEHLIKNDGVVLSHTYDALGRLQSLQSSDNTIHYIYEYDLMGNPIKVSDLINDTVSIRQYNEKGNLLREDLANGLTMNYQHDALDRPLSITLPDASQVTYQYQSTLLKTVNRIDPKGSVAYTHAYQAYDLSGRPTEVILAGNAGTQSYMYDILGRMTKAQSNRWEEQITCYDAVGNILKSQIKDSIGNAESLYTYDDLYQVTSEKGITSHVYSYDSHYNRRSKDGRPHRFNPLHQLLDDGIFTYSYDQNGNLIKKESIDTVHTFTYDALDRLVSFSNNQYRVDYTYDENNRRLSKSVFRSDVDTVTTRYLYQGQNEVGSIDATGTIQELRILGTGKGAEIGAAVALEIGSTVYVPLHDHIGNVACLLDKNTGDVVQTYRYSSFGEELFEGAISPWRFTSKRVDEESGLVYFGRRYYDAATGRWVTPDPIGRDGGPNLYAYVLNSPLTHFDLYGLFGLMDRAQGVDPSFWGGMTSVGTSFDGLCNFLGNALSGLARLPGRVISVIGHEFLPIPYVKKVVEFAGSCLEGKNPSSFEWKTPQSELIIHPGHFDPRTPHTECNGIGVSKTEFQDRLAKHSEEYGGARVYGMYNSGNGFVLDTLEILCQKLGIPTHMQRVTQEGFNQVLNDMGEYRTTGTIVHRAHSQGTETTYHLSPEVRHQMSVSGFGSARILQTNDFKDAVNYIGKADPVPLLDPFGLIAGLRSGNVHYIPSSGCPILDHYYENPEFIKIRESRAATQMN